jgi:FkbM family methyltransferase
MHSIRFERDGVWIDDGDGVLWSYQPGLFGSAMWAEYGAQYEEGETELLARLLPRGGTLVDVGANVGLHSIKLARRIEGLQVFAFEPIASTYEALLANASKNGVSEQLDARRMALSDGDGEIRLTKQFRVGNFVVPDGAQVADGVAETVPAKRLDDVLDGVAERVDLIKCDVEGSELAVLRGAESLLERFKPAIFVEVMERYTRRYGHEPEAVFQFLRERGYGHELVKRGQRTPSTGSIEGDLRQTTNFLFTVNRSS